MKSLPLVVLAAIGHLTACAGATPAPEAVAPEATPPAAVPPDGELAGAPVEPAPEAKAAGDNTVTAGPFTITPVMHASTVITVNGQTIWLDPWSKAPLEGAPKADLLLLTDIHQDHLDPAAIEAIRGEGMVVVAPQAVADQWEGGTVDHVLANGQSLTLGELTITGVPMYNLVRGPSEGTLFHDKGRGNGYLLESGGTTVYFAGDTECTDEMRGLEGVDLAFVPMNLPYTMTPAEAAECVRAFKPAVAVPYHYRDSDPGEFASALEGLEGVAVKRVEYYPG